MKHPRSKAQRTPIIVQIDTDAQELFLRRRAAAEGKVYVPQAASEVSSQSVRPARSEIGYCSAKVWWPEAETCARFKRMAGEQGAGTCRERCLAWVMRT